MRLPTAIPLVLASVLLLALSVSARDEPCKDLDCPGYEKLEDLGNEVELRRYSPSKWAVTDVDERGFEKATIVGFQRLFKYIFGDNELEQKIDMTAPVVTTVRLDPDNEIKDDFTVSFFLPYEFQPEDSDDSSPSTRRHRDTDPPAPRDDRIRIAKLGEIEAYVLPFDGFAIGYRVKRLALGFFNYLERNGHKDFDRTTFLIGVYDPPYKFVERHNEIWALKQGKTAVSAESV